MASSTFYRVFRVLPSSAGQEAARRVHITVEKRPTDRGSEIHGPMASVYCV